MEINFNEVVDSFIRGATLKNIDDLEITFLEELILGYENNRTAKKHGGPCVSSWATTT